MGFVFVHRRTARKATTPGLDPSLHCVNEMQAAEEIKRQMKAADQIGDWVVVPEMGIIHEQRLTKGKRSHKSGFKGLMCCVAPTPAAYD